MSEVHITTVPVADLEGILARAIRTELSNLLKVEPPQPQADELLTRKEAARYLGLSLPTLHDYTQRGIVTAYRIGSRVRYRRGELANALQKVQAAKYQRG
jgi:excisionase family DNA binding protein